MFTGAETIERAFAALGDLLRAQKATIAVVVVGGATLNLLGIIRRSTSDVDVIARAERDESGAFQLIRAEPFPASLRLAIRTVSRDFGLAEDWMNAAIGEQWSQGLPPWIGQDLTWRRYGGLEVGLVGRRTLVALKLFATVDQGPRSVHFQDLLKLAATDAELDGAAAWVKTQDASPAFSEMVEEAVARVRQHRS